MSARNASRHLDRLSRLLAFDSDLCQTHPEDPKPQLIVGVDEVGRGSLIGPVVAGAFCFSPDFVPEPEDALLPWLDDSKASHFTHARRCQLAEHLKTLGAWGIGQASQEEVERLNISKASLLAGFRAIEALFQMGLFVQKSSVLVVMDGRQTIPHWTASPQKAIIKADQQSAAVAAASVLAKAHRDSWVLTLEAEDPGYQWARNMGYPTPAHQEALLKFGPSPYHRRTYKIVQNAMAPQLAMALE